MTSLVYVSLQCPSCARLLDILRRLQLRVKVVNIDTDAPRHRITAVPTIVTKEGRSFTGTNAFMYLQDFEAECPLDRYALVSGEDMTMPYTDMDTNQTHNECPFSTF